MDDTISQIGASYRMMSDYIYAESFMDTLAAAHGLSLSTPHDVQKPADPR